METSAEACWRLSKACGQWAAASRDSSSGSLAMLAAIAQGLLAGEEVRRRATCRL
jgi:hypothetical protein